MEVKNTNSVSEKKREQTLAVRVSIIGSVALFLIAAGVGIAVDSITLILDAATSLVIVAVAFLMKYAINKIHRPADEDYHFGYNKYEPLVVSMQGLLIFTTCILVIKFAIQDIIHAEDIANHFIPVVATFISGIIGIFISVYLKRIATRTGSSMLDSVALHWRMDTTQSFGICLGFIFGFISQRSGYVKITPYVDPVMAIILALIFIAAPVKTILHNILELLDAVPRGDVCERIKKVLDMHKPEYLFIQRVRARKAGEKIFLDVVFTADSNFTIAQSEELAVRIEKDIKSELGNCDVVICFKPK